MTGERKKILTVFHFFAMSEGARDDAQIVIRHFEHHIINTVRINRKLSSSITMGFLFRCFVSFLLSTNYAAWHGAGAVVAETAEEGQESSCTAPPPRDACEASGAADRLNDLFNANTDSFRTSGLFFHGFDCGLGNLMGSEDSGCAWRFSILGSKLPQWSLGWEGMEPGPDAMCPTFDSDDATEPLWDYPRICPTPKAINLGSVSFTYSRADLGTPKEVIEAILASDQPFKAEQVWGPIGMMLAGAPIKDKADCPQFEPGAEFWDQGRVRGLFVTDGAAFSRDACGIGYQIDRIVFGYPNRNDGLPGVNLTASPHGSPLHAKEMLSQLEGPLDTKEFWCPSSGMSTLGDGNPYCGDKIDTPEAYYEYWKNTTDVLSERLKHLNITYADMQAIALCALDEGRFELFTQADRYENYPEFWKNKFDVNHPDFSASDRGVYNEATLRSFEGVKIKDIAPYLALYYLEEKSEDGTVDLSGIYMDDRRKEIYSIANAIYAKTGISVPVVAVDPEGLSLEDGVVQRPVVCGVPPKEPAPSDFRVDPPEQEEPGGGADGMPSLGASPAPAGDFGSTAPSDSSGTSTQDRDTSGTSVVQRIMFPSWSLALTFVVSHALYVH